MKHIAKIITLLIFLPTLTFAGGMKGKYTKTKTIDKEFSINSNGLVNLNNKYGAIDIETWNNNKVSIKVIITTNGNNENKVVERLEKIDVAFENSSQEVSAKTHFEKQNNSWNFFGKHNSVNMDIKYIVKMPVTCNLGVHMDYGNITLDKLEGNADIDCDYGKIYIGDLLGNETRINLDYSRGSTIDSMKDGSINIDYSTIDIEKAGNIDLNTDYSNTTFESLNDLVYNSDYGNIVVKNANKIEGNSDYVNMKFGNVATSLDVSADYGRLSVEKMGANFKLINVNTEYTGAKIGVARNSSFELIADSQYSGISVPDGFNFTKQIEKNNKKHYEGTYNGSNGKVTIKSQYGHVKIYNNN